MTDTTVTIETLTTPAPAPTLMNDSAARSPMGEILDQGAIAPTKAETRPATPDSSTTPSSETPPLGEQKPDAKPTEPTESGKVPETYADFTAPEGFTLSKEAVDAFTPIAKEFGLTQEQAQKLVNFHSEQMISAAKAPQATYENLRKDWRATITADPEISKASSGGMTGMDAVKLDIGRALTHVDPKLATDFRAAMDLTGAGDHPAFVKTFWKLSQLVAEGRHVAGNSPSPHGQTPSGKVERPSAAAALYPNLAR